MLLLVRDHLWIPPELLATWQDGAVSGMAGYADTAEIVAFGITVRQQTSGARRIG